MSAEKVLDRAAVVDDDRFDRRFALRAIRKSGLVREVFEFRGGDEALAWICGEGELRRLDVIFLDIKMPRMDGFEFLQALRLHTSNRPLVDVIAMLTTSLDPRDRERAAGFEEIKAYFDKPLIEAHLHTVARLWAEREGRSGASPH